MWIIRKNSKIRLEIGFDSENVALFRSGGLGKLKMIYADLYQNRWVSVNHYMGFQRAVFNCI